MAPAMALIQFARFSLRVFHREDSSFHMKDITEPIAINAHKARMKFVRVSNHQEKLTGWTSQAASLLRPSAQRNTEQKAKVSHP